MNCMQMIDDAYESLLIMMLVAANILQETDNTSE